MQRLPHPAHRSLPHGRSQWALSDLRSGGDIAVRRQRPGTDVRHGPSARTCTSMGTTASGWNGHGNATGRAVSQQPRPSTGAGSDDGRRNDVPGACHGLITNHGHQFATAASRRSAAFGFHASRQWGTGLDTPTRRTRFGHAAYGPRSPGLWHAGWESSDAIAISSDSGSPEHPDDEPVREPCHDEFDASRLAPRA